MLKATNDTHDRADLGLARAIFRTACSKKLLLRAIWGFYKNYFMKRNVLKDFRAMKA